MPKKKPDIPWNAQTKEAWDSLKFSQQEFLIEWISNGYNAKQAYLKTYNDKASKEVAAVSGNQILSSINVVKILEQLTKTNAKDLVLIKNVYTRALDSDNESIQLKGAESLAKLNGELIDRTKVEHSGKIDTEMDISKLSDKELLQLKALREKMG